MYKPNPLRTTPIIYNPSRPWQVVEAQEWLFAPWIPPVVARNKQKATGMPQGNPHNKTHRPDTVSVKNKNQPKHNLSQCHERTVQLPVPSTYSSLPSTYPPNLLSGTKCAMHWWYMTWLIHHRSTKKTWTNVPVKQCTIADLASWREINKMEST